MGTPAAQKPRVARWPCRVPPDSITGLCHFRAASGVLAVPLRRLPGTACGAIVEARNAAPAGVICCVLRRRLPGRISGRDALLRPGFGRKRFRRKGMLLDITSEETISRSSAVSSA